MTVMTVWLFDLIGVFAADESEQLPGGAAGCGGQRLVAAAQAGGEEVKAGEGGVCTTSLCLYNLLRNRELILVWQTQ